MSSELGSTLAKVILRNYDLKTFSQRMCWHLGVTVVVKLKMRITHRNNARTERKILASSILPCENAIGAQLCIQSAERHFCFQMTAATEEVTVEEVTAEAVVTVEAAIEAVEAATVTGGHKRCRPSGGFLHLLLTRTGPEPPGPCTADGSGSTVKQTRSRSSAFAVIESISPPFFVSVCKNVV